MKIKQSQKGCVRNVNSKQISTVRTVAKNSIWLLAGNVALRLIAALVVVLMVRALGDERFGQYSFAVAFVGFFTLIASFGFTTLLIRDIAKDKEQTSKYLNNVLSLKLVFAFVAFALLLMVSLFIDKPSLVKLIIYIFGIDLIISGFTEIMRSVFQAYELMEFDAITRIAEKIIWAALILLVIYNRLSLVNVALATLSATTIGLIVCYVLLKKRVEIGFEFNLPFWKKLIIDALPFAMTGLFAMIFFRIDIIMLSFITNDFVVGWYGAAYKIIDILATIPNIFLTALYPVFSRFHKEDQTHLSQGFALTVRYMILAAVPIVIGIFLLSDKIVFVFFGSGFANSSLALQILIFASLLSFINTPMFVMLNAIGLQKVTTINTASSATANVLLNLILIPSFGLQGAALATVVSEIIFFTLSYHQLKKRQYDPNIVKSGIKPVIAGVCMGAFIFLLHNWSIVFVIPLAAIFYFVMLFALREVSGQDKEIIKKVILRQ